jgi:VWFA-related protein
VTPHVSTRGDGRYVARRNAAAALACVLLGAWVPGVHGQSKPPEFPSSVDLVTVDVVVTDKKGHPARGLRLEDFSLLENGRPLPITSFEAISGPTLEEGPAETADPGPGDPDDPEVPTRLRRTFVVVFDQVHLTGLQADRCRRALEAFLKTAVREGDRMRIVAVSGFEFEGPTEEALRELSRLEGQRVPPAGPEAMSDYEAMRIDRFDDRGLMLRVIERIAVQTSGRRPDDREGERLNNASTTSPDQLNFATLDEGYVKTLARGVYDEAVRRNEATLATLESVLDGLSLVRGRKSVILVSSGLMKDPMLEGYQKVLDASSRANAAIYFLDARGLELIPGEAAEHGVMLSSIDSGFALASMAMEAQGSESLAADTGGFTVKNRNDLASGFRQIAADTRSYYLLGYTPPPARADGEFRKIEIKVARKGLEVRARKGYYASLPGTDRARIAAIEARRGLDANGEIPLRTASYLFGDAGAGKVRTLVATEADIRGLALELREGLLHGSLDLVIEVAPTSGGEPDRLIQQVDVSLTPERRKALETRGLPLARTLDLAPGGYDARVALSDRNSGHVGATSLRFEVPSERFRLSTPILSDVMEPGVDAGRDSPALGTGRRFRERATLYFQYEVYGAKLDPATGEPAVVSSWSIRDRAGTEWARSEPARLETAGHRAPGRLGQVDLTFPPGEYTLVLDARDQLAARAALAREPFTVEPR